MAGGSRAVGAPRSVFGAMALAGLLAACSVIDGTFTQDGEPPADVASADERASDGPRSLGRIGDFNRVQSPAPPAPPPPLDAEASSAPDGPKGALPSDSVAGNKALPIEAELVRLRAAVATHTERYEQLRASGMATADEYRMAAAEAPQYAGGTAADGTAASRHLDAAQTRLDGVADAVREMETLRKQIVSDAALAVYLQEQAQAASEHTDTGEADRPRLRQLEAEGGETLVALKSLLGEIDEGIFRQTAFITREQRNLNTLVEVLEEDGSINPGERSIADAAGARQPERSARNQTERPLADGGRSQAQGTASPENVRAAPVPPPAPRAAPRAADAAVAAATGSRDPLMEIAFGGSDVEYEAQLYAVISEAVVRNPSASFEVVAVSAGGRPGASLADAKQHAERVARSLMNMGVPAARLKQSARSTPDSGDDRVLVFVM